MEKFNLSIRTYYIIAAVHYNYMRDVAPDDTTFFRYVDWILTVPLMCG